MQKLYFLRPMLIMLISASINVVTQGQNFQLIDINKIKNSYPRNDEYSEKNAFTFFKGYSYFTADDGIHGRELWKTDGTASGTQLVKDVNPGTASSDNFNGYDITVSGGRLFFVASDGTHEMGLWVSDGTSAGTTLVVHIGPDISPNLLYLTDVNGTLFFVASYFDPNLGSINQLWKTDGTPVGTILVSDFTNTGLDLQQLVNVNGRLFFTFYSFFTGNTGLYISDGTSAGTNVVATFVSFNFPVHLTASNGLLYFAADAFDGTGGKLWVSDGTPGGTTAVNNTNNINLPVNFNLYSDTFAIINNVLYFQGITPDAGNELCKYDPEDPAPNVTIVKDIIPGANSSYPSFMTNVNGTLFFTIGPAGEDAQLWKSDGSESGTVLVKDINPGGDNFYYGLTSANGILMFAYGSRVLGFELWKSDGTDAGTEIVKDIDPGIYSSFPQYITFNNGLFLFGASDGAKGYELWKSDGTAAGTTIVKDINRTSTSSSYPFGFTATANNKIVFNAADEKYGYELRVTDGTNAGTKLVKDINPGTFDSYPTLFTKFKNKTYFTASDATGLHLWKTNGTSAGTTLVATPVLVDGQNGFSLNMVATDDLLYIATYNYSTGQGNLWRSDATSAGTYIVLPNIPNPFNLFLTAVGNTLYFTNFDGINGYELWKTEGTITFTGLVKDIYPGFGSSSPFNLFNFNGKLYFSASNGQAPFGNTLWTSDGTDAGTRVVKPILVNYLPFAQAHGKLFFSAENAVAKGTELFATDGTTAGTKIVKDIYPGANSSNISSLVSGDTLVYFLADDGTHGQELWKSNGTKEGTKLVKDITKGLNGSFPVNMINVNGKLFFTINDTLWQSDGTKAGTHPVNDAGLNGVTSIFNLASINGSLYFSGFTPTAGQELYVGSVSGAFSPVQMVTDNTIISNLKSDEFAVKLLTNPVTDQLKFSVSIKNRQAAQVIIVDASGRVVKAEKRALSPGTNMISYDTNAWAQGIYIIHIVTADGSTSLLKALK